MQKIAPFIKCFDVCGECPHYKYRKRPDGTSGVHVCAAINLDEPASIETLEGHPLVPGPGTRRLQHCPIRSGEQARYTAGRTFTIKWSGDRAEQARLDKEIEKKCGKFLNLPIPVPVPRPWDTWCEGESIRINPYGFSERTAVARVEAFNFGPYLLALSFEIAPPFLGPADSFRLRTEKGQPVMILFRDCNFSAGSPNGPWVEMSDQGRYEIETIQP